MIDKAALVLTDSFHATVFSILMNSAFLTRISLSNKRGSRIINLLEKFDFKERLIEGDIWSYPLPDDLFTPNFKKANELSVIEKKVGQDFLQRSMK